MTIRQRSDIIFFNSEDTKPTAYWVTNGLYGLELDTRRLFQYSRGSWQLVGDRTTNVETTTTSVSNTAAETTIYTGELFPSDFQIGSIIQYTVHGVITNATASD